MATHFQRILVMRGGTAAIRIARACRKLGIGTVGLQGLDTEAQPRGEGCDEVLDYDSPEFSTEALAKHIREAKADAVHIGFSRHIESRIEQTLSALQIPCIGGIESRSEAPMKDHGQFLHRCGELGLSTAPVLEQPMHTVEELAEHINTQKASFLVTPWLVSGACMPDVVSEQEEPEALQRIFENAQRKTGSRSVALVTELRGQRFLRVPVVVFSDSSALVLPERDFSLRIRSGLPFEETPCPALLQSVREQELSTSAHQAARDLAVESGYLGLIHVFFTLVPQGLLVPTHLQCGLDEFDSVSELASGRDLVEHQIRIAEGKVPESSVFVPTRSGHACGVVVRSSSKDVTTSRQQHLLRLPPISQGRLRIDSPFSSNQGRIELPNDNATLAQFTTYAPRRLRALLMLDRSLAGTVVSPWNSNLEALRAVLNDETIRAGQYFDAPQPSDES